MAIRNEIYNPNRFKEIVITVTDYDMPHISGIELMKTMEFQPEISRYSQIILTGKISSEFKEKLSNLHKEVEYIGKDDPQYIDKLLKLVKQRSDAIFQWSSYEPARLLSRNMDEKSSFLFDGNFAEIFESYIKENNICEYYIFDKQGSYLFLDWNANLSWLFIRNETGIDNSITRAAEHGAPKSVLDVLRKKEMILSLYEKEDFDNRGKIDWEQYLLPARVLESSDQYIKFFPSLIANSGSNSNKGCSTIYYYAFTKNFPEHGIMQDKILSYEKFLQG
ncbi:MAG: hypothetical protein A3F18_01635 [Legionellales bacterium RIFCSPHIGHO2_12_FULL_37_14]|nr:MAG: hypothetical protein A3F18_01635 [Legionellales bacterium RIFCSPHIGHO2_12_FULL_37_14]